MQEKDDSFYFWILGLIGFIILILTIYSLDRAQAQEAVLDEEYIVEKPVESLLVEYTAKPVMFLSSTKITLEGYPIDATSLKPNSDFLLGEVARYKRALSLCNAK